LELLDPKSSEGIALRQQGEGLTGGVAGLGKAPLLQQRLPQSAVGLSELGVAVDGQAEFLDGLVQLPLAL
jgi:hypothetical protein